MKQYKETLTNSNIFQTMSGKANCFDNFFGLLNQEKYYGVIYTSYEPLNQIIIEMNVRIKNTNQISLIGIRSNFWLSLQITCFFILHVSTSSY